MAFSEGDNVYVTALPWPGASGEAPHIERRRASLPIRTITKDGGMFPRWTPDWLLYLGSGPRITTYDPDTDETTRHEITLDLPRSRGKGSAVLTGARIVTLGDQGTLEEGVVRIVDGRIACVGDCVRADEDREIDLSGKTIVPGFIDMHAHHHRDHTGVFPRRNWEAGIYLAYGMTTTLDNSQWSQNVFAAAELVEAGEMVGPRMYSTGDPMYNGDGSRQNDIRSYQDAEDNNERLTSWGATAIKSYMQPRRDQRQWIAEISRERKLMLTGEGGSLVYNVGLILDGQTAWEHPLTYIPLYADAARFFGRTKTVYSITFVVGGPSVWNEEYFWQETANWEDPKQQRWLPWRMLIPHTRRAAAAAGDRLQLPAARPGSPGHRGRGRLGGHRRPRPAPRGRLALGDLDGRGRDGRRGSARSRDAAGRGVPRARARARDRRGRQARRPRGAEPEPAGRHSGHRRHPPGGEGRPDLRRGHPGRGLGPTRGPTAAIRGSRRRCSAPTTGPSVRTERHLLSGFPGNRLGSARSWPVVPGMALADLERRPGPPKAGS